MKKFTFLITLFLLVSAQSVIAQKVVIIGMNHATPDGFSFVATETIPIGEIIYFTDNEYSDAANAFTFNGASSGEAVVKFTVTSALSSGDVVFVNEISSNTFTITGSGGLGTAVISTFTNNGSFSLPPDGDNVYAYSDTDENPVNGITKIYSVLYTGSGESPVQNGGTIPPDANPVGDFPNSIVVDGFTYISTPDRVEFNRSAAVRTNVSKVMLENPSNYETSTALALSTQFFTNLNLSGANPVLTVTASSSSVTENSGSPITYTFSLSTNAGSNITVNFSVGGTATFTTDYTQSGAATFSASSGTVTIASGSNSASFTITPVGDANLEPNETVILTLTTGTGYDAGSPGAATSTILNDDTSTITPLVAVTGINEDDPEGFSFVALDDITSGTIVYFTENPFDNTALAFTGTEGVLKWTAPPAGVLRGEVIVVKENPANTFTATSNSGNSGTISLISGTLSLASTGEEFYAYSDADNNPLNGVTIVYSVMFTGTTITSGGNIPAIEDPSSVYIGSVVVDGFAASPPNRTEYDPAKRGVTVDQANFQNITNWVHAQANANLSPVPFANIIIASGSANPTATVAVSPSSVFEDSGTGLVFTFSLSAPASGDITINFSVGGTATFNTDYTVSGAASFTASTGSITILDGTSSAAVTIMPTVDPDVEVLETVNLMIDSGTGYDGGSPNDATGSITNDDTSLSDPLVAITGLNHLDNDCFSFVAAQDIPANTKIYFTENSFNNTTLIFGSGESVLSWTSPASIVPAGQVIVVTENAPTTSNSFSITRSGGANAGSIALLSGDFAIATDGETIYAYNDNDNDPTNGVVDIYAVLFTGASGSPGGTIPTTEDPSGIYLNALVVDGFPATPPNRTEYDPTKRNVTVEAVNFKDVSNWNHAEANQLLSTVPFDDLKIIASPELTTSAIVTFTATSALMGGDITNGGSTLVTERGVVYSMVDITPTIGEIDVIKDDNGTGSGVFSELIGSLIPNTTYYVQAYATNSLGTSYGGVESFTTNFEIAIWNGSLSDDWFTGGNWDGVVVPDADFNVFIPGDLTNYPTITAAAECNNLILESTETSTASLLGQENLTVNGIVVIERFMSGNQWHMVASPVPSQTINSFLTANTNIPTKNVDDRGMIDYDEATDNWNNLFTTTQSGNLTSGKGFSLRTDADDVVVFFGTLETGNVSPSVTTSGNGWNCIGNPYPAAIFINDAADVTNNFINININEFEPSYAAIYVWEQANEAYSIVNLGDAAFYAQLGQGFFAKAKTGVTQMQFTTAMQTHQPTASFKSIGFSTPEIKLTAKLEGHQSSTRIKFNDDMQTKLDIGYDAGIFKNGFDLYSQLVEDNGVDFGIQYLPTSSMNKVEISLGLDSKYGGPVVFSSELINISNEYQVVLEDRLTNTFTSLNESQVYSAQINEDSQGKGRFYLHTSNSNTGLGNDNLNAQFTVYNDYDKIYINGQVQGRAVATLYDLMGRKMHVLQLEQTPLNYISTSNIKSGIYMLNIEYQGGAFNQKIPVNK